jgi:hypothetical protein
MLRGATCSCTSAAHDDPSAVVQSRRKHPTRWVRLDTIYYRNVCEAKVL